MCVCENGDKKERSVENIFFFLSLFHMTDYVFISTHCSTNVILALIVMNNITKELVMIALLDIRVLAQVLTTKIKDENKGTKPYNRQ